MNAGRTEDLLAAVLNRQFQPIHLQGLGHQFMRNGADIQTHPRELFDQFWVGLLLLHGQLDSHYLLRNAIVQFPSDAHFLFFLSLYKSIDRDLLLPGFLEGYAFIIPVL